MKTTGLLAEYDISSCRGYGSVEAARAYAEHITEKKRETRYIILAGDVFFVSDTADIQNYEKLLFIYEKGTPVQKNINFKNIGEQEYSNKYKTIGGI